MSRVWARRVAVLGSFLVLSGCQKDEELSIPLPSATEAPDEILFTPGQMKAGLEWAESDVLPSPAGATRIGMLIDLELPDALQAIQDRIEVRGFDQDGSPTEWIPAQLTWSEDVYLVARADVGRTIYGAQVRLPSEHLQHVRSVAFTAVAFTAVVPPAVSPGEVDGFDTQANALSVSGLVKPRSAWKAKATKCSGTDGKKYRMAIHHTYTPAASNGSYAARIRSIQAYHMDARGWCDVGYHYLVTQDGTVWEGRPIKYRGAHVANSNSGNIGISFVGCFQSGDCGSIGTMQPSQAGLNITGQLIAALSDQYDIAKSKSHIKGHGQHSGANTACPGDLLLAKIPTILDIANDGVSGGGGSNPPDEPPVTAGGPVGRVLGVVWDLSVTNGPADPGAKRLASAVVSVAGQSVTVDASTAFWDFTLAPGSYTVTASVAGYDPASRTITVSAGSETWASIGLKPAGSGGNASGPAIVRIKNASGGVLADSVLHHADLGWMYTDGAGAAAVPVPNGTATVTAYGAEHMGKTVTVKAGQSVDVKLSAPGAVWTKGTMQGVVWDLSTASSPSAAGAKTLAGALVICSSGEAQRARSGDAYWAFTLNAGSYSFTAVANGYTAASVSGAVQQGDAAWGSVGLLPVGSSPNPPADPPAEPPPSSTPGSGSTTVCYPGAANTWDVCFDLISKANLNASGYNYPAGGPDAVQYAAPNHFLDLKGLATSTKLAKNFTVGEFMQAYKGQYAVYSPKAVAHWQAIRSKLGVALSITSGFRSPGYNAGISGAATYSRHMYGDAADASANGAVSLTTLSNACKAEGADFVKIYTSHVHCDWRYDALDPGFWAAAGKPGAGKPGAHKHADDPGEPTDAWVDPPEYQPHAGDAVFLKARHIGFDEGTPWVTWRVTGPDTDLVVEPAENLAFVTPTAGTYTVTWTVGGFVQGELAVVALP